MESDNEDTWSDEMLDEDESDSFEDVDNAFEGQENDSDESREESDQKVLITSQVVEVLFKELKEVQSIIQIPMTSVRILLNHFKWDKQKLYERYYQEGDSEDIFEEAKVLSPSKIEELAAKTLDSPSSTDCEICFLPLPEISKAGLECGHLFCTGTQFNGICFGWRNCSG